MRSVARLGRWAPGTATIHPFITFHRPYTAPAAQGLVVRQYRRLERRRSRTDAIANSGTDIQCLTQSKDSWSLLDKSNSSDSAAPRLLLVDGTNLACLCAGGRHKRRSVLSESIEGRVASWLTFLQLYTQATTVLVAFDNKGSITANVRAQLVPGYLKKRYNAAAAAAGGGDLSGWAHLGAVVRHLQQQQQQQQQHQQQRVGSCCYLVANAAYGYEADDVLSAVAAWASQQLSPRPLVIIASSDSDMQQLMDDHTYWLELLQVPSKHHPSGLQLHSAVDFHRTHGFTADKYGDYLALIGKTEAGITGIGVSTKMARSLIQKFGSVEHILAAAHQGALKQFGPAMDKLFSSSSSTTTTSSSSSSNAAGSIQRKLITNKSIFKLYGDQQVKLLPQQHMHECHAAATEQQQQGVDTAAAGSSAAMAAVHPAVAAHMRQIRPYVEQISRCLQQLGIHHKVGCLTTGGIWCDIIVQIYGGSSSSGQQQRQQWEPNLDTTAASDLLVIQLLSPADLDNGMLVTTVTPSSNRQTDNLTNTQNNSHFSTDSHKIAVDQLAHQLAERCGCYVHGNSNVGYARRKLLEYATGAAKRRLSLLKGYKVAVIPFYEVHLAGAAAVAAAACEPLAAPPPAGAPAATEKAAAGTSDAVMQYIEAVLQEQCGTTWKPPCQQQQRQLQQQQLQLQGDS